MLFFLSLAHNSHILITDVYIDTQNRNQVNTE